MNRGTTSLLTRESSSTYAFWVSTLMYCCLPQQLATALSRSPKPCRALNDTDEIFTLLINLALSPHIPFHFIHLKTPGSIKGEYKVKSEGFMTLRDETLIIFCILVVACAQNNLHWNIILVLNKESRNFVFIHFNNVTFKHNKTSFTLIPYFQKESLVGVKWPILSQIFCPDKIKNTYSIFEPATPWNKNPTTVLPNQIKLKIYFVWHCVF